MWKNTPAALYLWKDNASIAQLDNCLSVLLRGKKNSGAISGCSLFCLLPLLTNRKQRMRSTSSDLLIRTKSGMT